ncbi:MAG: hypothetical protein AAF456_14585 [Planctomycetota bacterium]
MKLLLIPVLLVVACILAGTYGAIHNQVSYTVSPEYFTKYKFQQFGMIHFQDRVGAAYVGWSASWWMGAVIGIVLIPLGLLIRGNRNYFPGMIRVFGVVAATTMTVGLVALAVAFMIVDAETVGELTRYGNAIDDDVAFARAGTMHNFSYVGGLVGIVNGAVDIFRQRKRYTDYVPANGTTRREG